MYSTENSRLKKKLKKATLKSDLTKDETDARRK